MTPLASREVLRRLRSARFTAVAVTASADGSRVKRVTATMESRLGRHFFRLTVADASSSILRALSVPPERAPTHCMQQEMRRIQAGLRDLLHADKKWVRLCDLQRRRTGRRAMERRISVLTRGAVAIGVKKRELASLVASAWRLAAVREVMES